MKTFLITFFLELFLIATYLRHKRNKAYYTVARIQYKLAFRGQQIIEVAVLKENGYGNRKVDTEKYKNTEGYMARQWLAWTTKHRTMDSLIDEEYHQVLYNIDICNLIKGNHDINA